MRGSAIRWFKNLHSHSWLTSSKNNRMTGSAATVTQQQDALSFTPTAGAAGTTSTTTFVLTDASTAGDIGDQRQQQRDGHGPGGATTSADTAAPDAVSIDPAVTYKGGILTLTGTASSASGVSSVEISADVDGTRQDLGAATVNANGTFAFSDVVGDQQSFFVATLTDDAAAQAMSADPDFNLTGGLGPTGGDRPDTAGRSGSPRSSCSPAVRDPSCAGP